MASLIEWREGYFEIPDQWGVNDFRIFCKQICCISVWTASLYNSSRVIFIVSGHYENVSAYYWPGFECSNPCFGNQLRVKSGSDS